MNKFNKKILKYKLKAFTLAEVLIVLTIIGIVASITLPALMNNINDMQYKLAYKKAYSMANQAWSQALTNNEVYTRVAWNDPVMNDSYFNTFKSKFNVVKDCNNNNNYQCWNSNGEKPSNKYPLTNALAFVDNSGMSWSMPCNPGDSCGDDFIWGDTNGFKGPNQFGKDRFRFVVRNHDNSNGAGMPVKIQQVSDLLSVDTYCAKPPCYNTSWLTGAQ